MEGSTTWKRLFDDGSTMINREEQDLENWQSFDDDIIYVPSWISRLC